MFQAIQGKLWGQRPKDWADIQERTALNCYESYGQKKTWKIKLGHANGRAFFLRLTAMVRTRTKAGPLLCLSVITPTKAKLND